MRQRYHIQFFDNWGGVTSTYRHFKKDALELAEKHKRDVHVRDTQTGKIVLETGVFLEQRKRGR